jgi:hypothetical protein
MSFSLFPRKKLTAAEILPYMTPDEIEVVKSVLDGCNGPGDLRVFEYGSGGSTVYFPRYLTAKGRAHKWFSLEHDLVWAREVLGLLNESRLTGVQLLACEVPGYKPAVLNSRPKRVKLLAKGVRFDYSNYTDVPRRLGGGFDMVIVDGRDRKNCVNMAVSVLNPGGTVLLHDAERDFYQCVMRNYPGKMLSPRLWVYRKEA